MRTVAIFGVGLIGGSFALALKKNGYLGTILGVSSAETLRRALALGVIDKAAHAEDAARAADLIYLSQPVCSILDLIPQLNDWVRPDALITDAGSTKKAIVQRASECITRCRFLGGHPLAGKEQRGVDAAEASLFHSRPYVFTPLSPDDLRFGLAQELLDWVQRFGATPAIVSPEEHDRIVANTSHLPQLLSTALAAMLNGQGESVSRIFGPALIDSTRLALSPIEVWDDIFETNREAIDRAVSDVIAKLECFQRDLRTGGMSAHFFEAAAFAKMIRQRS